MVCQLQLCYGCLALVSPPHARLQHLTAVTLQEQRGKPLFARHCRSLFHPSHHQRRGPGIRRHAGGLPARSPMRARATVGCRAQGPSYARAAGVRPLPSVDSRRRWLRRCSSARSSTRARGRYNPGVPPQRSMPFHPGADQSRASRRPASKARIQPQNRATCRSSGLPHILWQSPTDPAPAGYVCGPFTQSRQTPEPHAPQRASCPKPPGSLACPPLLHQSPRR